LGVILSLSSNISPGLREFISRIHAFDEQADFSSFKQVQPTVLGKYEKEFHSNPESSHARANFEGHLFEMYVTNLLIRTANELDYVDWIIPIQENKNSRAEHTSDQNRLSRDTEGSIVMFREGKAYAEYDSIVSLEGNIIVVEFKHGKSKASLDVEDIDKRMGKLASAFNCKPSLIVIKPEGNIPLDYKEREKMDPDFILISLKGFESSKNIMKSTRTSFRA
jgi:hypothetical protein